MENKLRHEIIEKLEKQLNLKNKNYGNSFGDTVRNYGDVAFLTRISDKFKRIEYIITHPDVDVADESLLDSIEDLSGYCILMLEEKERVYREDDKF